MLKELIKTEIIGEIDQSISQLVGLMSSLSENKINHIPYEESWTAGQLLRHVSKSINGMAKALRKESSPAQRDPEERIQELKKTFLDFSNKMKSPDFIIPEKGPYDKQTSIDELYKSFEQLKESINNANLTDMVDNLPLGPITKLEISHFVLYHTQRHLYQMKKICDSLNLAVIN